MCCPLGSPCRPKVYFITTCWRKGANHIASSWLLWCSQSTTPGCGVHLESCSTENRDEQLGSSPVIWMRALFDLLLVCTDQTGSNKLLCCHVTLSQKLLVFIVLQAKYSPADRQLASWIWSLQGHSWGTRVSNVSPKSTLGPCHWGAINYIRLLNSLTCWKMSHPNF